LAGRSDRDGDSDRPSFVIDVSGDEAQGQTIADNRMVRHSHVRGTSSDAPPNMRLGRMIAVRALGDGGMGRVYEAHDPELSRDVAVKVMHDSIVGDPLMRERFLSEAQITAQLEHPSIVPVYDMGKTPDGAVFLVMKRVRGRSLRDVLDALATGEPEAVVHWTRHRLLTSFLKVCQAVAYAHAQGVLHRDLKPANIMLGEFGEVQVLDWGVARRMPSRPAPEDAPESTEGTIVGTPGYISPEQVMGRVTQQDARSDVWSLGAILYEILTTEPAFHGEGAMEVLLKTVKRRPTPPPLRAPHANVPKELTDICSLALEPKPDARFQSAADLANAIERFLEGSRRREEASRHLERAEAVWTQCLEVGERRAELMLEAKRHADAADAWAPLSEKQELIATRAAIAELETPRAKLFAEFVTLCEKALTHEPSDDRGRGLLARAYWTKLEEAEQQRDAAGIAYYSDRVATYDDGAFVELLQGGGTLSLRTDPDGAEVLCQRYDTHGLVLPLGSPEKLGTTPLRRVPLPMGSYLLTLRSPGKRDTVYPVHIGRCQHWDSGRTPIPLYADDVIGDDYRYVPAGIFMCGGDADAPGSKALCKAWVDGFFVARFPVTMQSYVDFLNDLHEHDPAEAWRRCPRSEGTLSETEGQYLRRPHANERYVLPLVDADGNEWDPDWPVFGVSWQDATAFTKWLTKRDGTSYRLPREQEREKAARGVDGRYYPWGNGFDRTLCKMGDSRRERARPEPIGAFPTDVSIYGVRDLAGSMRDWCGDLEFDDDATLRPVRGGSWNYDPRFCRAACRLGRPPWRVFSYNGFRLARGA